MARQLTRAALDTIQRSPIRVDFSHVACADAETIIDHAAARAYAEQPTIVDVSAARPSSEDIFERWLQQQAPAEALAPAAGWWRRLVTWLGAVLR